MDQGRKEGEEWNEFVLPPAWLPGRTSGRPASPLFVYVICLPACLPAYLPCLSHRQMTPVWCDVVWFVVLSCVGGGQEERRRGHVRRLIRMRWLTYVT